MCVCVCVCVYIYIYIYVVYILKPSLPIHPMSAPPFLTFASLLLPCKAIRESQSSGGVRCNDGGRRCLGCHHMLSIRQEKERQSVSSRRDEKRECLPGFRNSMPFLMGIECLWSKYMALGAEGVTNMSKMFFTSRSLA